MCRSFRVCTLDQKPQAIRGQQCADDRMPFRAFKTWALESVKPHEANGTKLTIKPIDRHAIIFVIMLHMLKFLMLKAVSIVLMFSFFNVATASDVVRVGVIPGMPFASLEKQGNRGIVIDIWKRVAFITGITYVFVPYTEDINAAILDVSNEKIDLLIGPISTTHEREKLVDFTRPYFLNQIGLVFRDETSLFSVVATELFEGELGKLILLFFISILIFASLLIWVRRKDLPERSLKDRVIDETWESASMVIALAIPEGRMNGAIRIIVFLGLIFGIGFISFFTSVLTSKLTVENLSAASQRFASIKDLNQAHLIAVSGRTTVEYARKVAGKVTLAKNLQEAMTGLARGEADGVVEDYAIAAEFVKKWQGEQKLVMSSLKLGNDEYAFALTKLSPLRQKIDAAITELQDNGMAKEICKTYVENLSDLCEL